MQELIRQLDACELTSSRCPTPCLSPSPSLTVSQIRLKERNIAFIQQQQGGSPGPGPGPGTADNSDVTAAI